MFSKSRLVKFPLGSVSNSSSGKLAFASRGDQVYRSSERVRAHQGAGAVEKLDPLHVVERKQVEVDLRGVGLILSNAVHEDRHALRRAEHRPRRKAARGQRGLVPGA